MKKYSVIGNNLTIKLRQNKTLLKIIGNNNVVDAVKNEGAIVMMGSNCTVSVQMNYGTVTVLAEDGDFRGTDYKDLVPEKNQNLDFSLKTKTTFFGMLKRILRKDHVFIDCISKKQFEV